MLNTKLSTVAKIVCGKIFGSDVTFNTVIIDTRKITKGCLFVALKGKCFDAHDFAFQIKEKGASALVVNRKLDINLPQVIVKNTRIALGKIAAWCRQQISTKVIALTGSSGKTSVKEMTAIILSQCGNTLCTKDNLNNDIGVAMTLLRLTNAHKYAVIELGANHQGEISWTASLVHPEVALVNNLSPAHLEGFGSLKGLSKTKGEIYAGLSTSGIAIMNGEDNDWVNWKNIIGSRKTWYFSLTGEGVTKSDSDFTYKNAHLTTFGMKFTLCTPIGSINVSMPLMGYHNIANAMAAAALSIAVGAPLEAVQTGLSACKTIPGRLFLISLAKNQFLLDDSYNSNVGSMTAAIHVLCKMPRSRVMVVGDMAELGNESEAYHVKIGKIVKASHFNHVLSIGTFSRIISDISGVGEHFYDKSILINRLKMLIKECKSITILVKGSRSAAMEEIVYALQESRPC